MNKLDKALRQLVSLEVEVKYIYQKLHEARYLRDENKVKELDDRLVKVREKVDAVEKEVKDLREQGFRESIFDIPEER